MPLSMNNLFNALKCTLDQLIDHRCILYADSLYEAAAPDVGHYLHVYLFS